MCPQRNDDGDDGHRNELERQSESTKFLVGRLSGAVEQLISRMNRSDDFVDKGFKDIRDQISQSVAPVAARLTVVETSQDTTATRLTTIEARSGRVAIPAGGIGAIIGAVVAAFTSHWLGKIP